MSAEVVKGVQTQAKGALAADLIDHVGLALFNLALQVHGVELKQTHLIIKLFSGPNHRGAFLASANCKKIRFIIIRYVPLTMLCLQIVVAVFDHIQQD